MGLSDAQKTWMDQNWALFCVDEPWRKVDTKGPHADALARAKEQARTACPRVDTKPPGPAKTIGKKSKQANTLTAHPALAAGPEWSSSHTVPISRRTFLRRSPNAAVGNFPTWCSEWGPSGTPISRHST